MATRVRVQRVPDPSGAAAEGAGQGKKGGYRGGGNNGQSGGGEYCGCGEGRGIWVLCGSTGNTLKAGGSG